MDLIKPFDPWRSRLCSCPPKYSLSAYSGCGHNCLYCYASSYIPNFYKPRPKAEFLKKLSKEAAKIPPGSIIAISNSSDPYQPLEKKLELTRKCLEILKDFDLKINLVTKSDLILKDTGLLKKIKKLLVSISLTCLDNNLAAKLEPNCPPPRRRLAAAKKLSEIAPVVVRLDPLIWPLAGKYIEKAAGKIKKTGARQVITSTYKAKPDNFRRMKSAFPRFGDTWDKLYLAEGRKKNNCIYLGEKLRRSIIAKARKEILKLGMDFSSCREGFTDLNTNICDGTGFFEKPAAD